VPATGAGAAGFGQITNTDPDSNPRLIQFGLRFSF